MSKNAFAEQIYLHNTRMKISKKDLAKLVDVSVTTIGNWERGTHPCDASNLRELLRVYLLKNGFLKGEELSEAKALWQLWLSVRYGEADDRPKEIFDENWFKEELLKAQTFTVEPSPAVIDTTSTIATSSEEVASVMPLPTMIQQGVPPELTGDSSNVLTSLPTTTQEKPATEFVVDAKSAISSEGKTDNATDDKVNSRQPQDILSKEGQVSSIDSGISHFVTSQMETSAGEVSESASEPISEPDKTRKPGSRFVSAVSRRTVLVGLTSFLAGTITSGVIAWKIDTRGQTRVQWNVTGSMQLGRSSFRATTLNNGMVLVEGGDIVDNGYTNESERFDPLRSVWTRTRGVMYEKRAEHTATLLTDGKVLVIGGFAIYVKDSAEWYDPATDTWTLTRHTMSVPRTRHTATLLYGGYVLVAGGLNNVAHTSAELYDAESDSWQLVASMHTARMDHIAVRLFDGRVLVAGGTTANDGHSCTNKAEIYDPRTNVWTDLPDMMLARAYFTATLLPDGRVLVIGGRLPSFDATPTIEIYNPYTNTWSFGAPMHYGRQNPRGDSALLLEDGTVLVIAGDTAGTSEVYIPTKDAWSSPRSLHNTHYACSTALLSEGRVLVAGGLNTFTSESNSTHQSPSTEIYTP